MKKLAVVFLFLSAVAMAGSVVTYSQSNATTATQSFAKTDGIPAQHPNGTDLQAVHITVSSPDDAGQGDEILRCNFRAFKYTSQNVATDGGVGYAWSRYPRLDTSVIGDTDTNPYVNVREGGLTVTLPNIGDENIFKPMGTNARLAWVTELCVSQDGGSPSMQMITIGYYK